jgi:hypothetical protein
MDSYSQTIHSSSFEIIIFTLDLKISWRLNWNYGGINRWIDSNRRSDR